MTGNSNNFTKPKSSPVASERPLDERLAQLTSALSALRGHTPITSLPRTLKCPQQINTFSSSKSLKIEEKKQAEFDETFLNRHFWVRHAIFPEETLCDESKEYLCKKLQTKTTYLVHDAHVILLISFLSFKGFPPGTVNTNRS